ncbi:MAG: hypothetical protein ABS876_04840 [Ruminococcus sp.]
MKINIQATTIAATTTPAITQIHHFLYQAPDGAGAGGCGDTGGGVVTDAGASCAGAVTGAGAGASCVTAVVSCVTTLPQY